MSEKFTATQCKDGTITFTHYAHDEPYYLWSVAVVIAGDGDDKQIKPVMVLASTKSDAEAQARYKQKGDILSASAIKVPCRIRQFGDRTF